MRPWRFVAIAFVALLSLAGQDALAASSTPWQSRPPVPAANPLAPPRAAPGQPGTPSAYAANGSAVVTWSAPSGTVTAYQVTEWQLIQGVWYPIANSQVTFELPTLADVSGLTNGATYRFTVNAENSSGWGAASNPSAQIQPTSTIPSGPINLSATPGNGSVTLSWAYPSGVSVDHVLVRVYTSGGQAMSYQDNIHGTSTTITGLTNGTTYTFDVRIVTTGLVLSTGTTTQSTPGTVTVAPGQPGNVAAYAGNQTALVDWAAPTSGGAAGGYQVHVYQLVGSVWQAVSYPTVTYPLSNLATVSGLTNGASYRFTVTAYNSAGSSTESAPSLAVIPGVFLPAPPLNATATPGNGSVTLSWTPPSGQVVDHYFVEVYGPNSQPVSYIDGIHGTSVTVSGLTNGVTYRFEISIVDPARMLSPTTQVYGVAGVSAPSAPGNVKAVLSNGAVVVSWNAPANGGSAIVAYRVTAYAGSSTSIAAVADVGGNATSATLSSLTPSTQYTFTVAALNSVGWGPESARTALLTLATVPTAVQNLTATASGESATVTWDAPLSNGGSPILGYQIIASGGSGGAITVQVTGSSATLTGLQDGVSYVVTVVAVNAVGNGPAVSTVVTPINLPPTLTVPGNQTFPFGASVNLAVTAADTNPGDHLALTASGLPSGLTFVDSGNRSGSVTGALQANPGTYTVTFSVSDGHNPPVTHTMVITVMRARVRIRPDSSNPRIVHIASPLDTTGPLTLRVAVIPQTGAGLASQVAPVRFIVRRMGSSDRFSAIGSITSLGPPVETEATFHHLPVGVYRLTVRVAGADYVGSGVALFAVLAPRQPGGISGTGRITAHGVSTHFTLVARVQPSGRLVSSFIYVRHSPGGDMTLRGRVIGGIIFNGSDAYFQGTGMLNGKHHYRFAVAVHDGGPSGPDRLSLWLIDPHHIPVPGSNFSNTLVTGGEITITPPS